MKFSATALVFSAALCAQIPSALTPGSAPPAAAAPVPPDAVVAQVGTQKLTAAQMDALLAGFPASVQQAVRSQPGRGLVQIYMLKHLAEEAEKGGLDKQSPFREALEYGRLNLLSQAEVQTYRYGITVTPEEVEKLYQERPERFEQARVKVIYLPFAGASEKPGADGKAGLTEAAAKSRIEELRKQIAAGADFGKLARENSGDKASAERDGDFGMIQRSSAYPDSIKNTVLAMKAGEVSQPIREAKGFYLIRVEERRRQPFAEVKSDLYEELKQARFQAWLKGLETQFTVKIENPGYFSAKPSAPPQPVR